MINILYLDLSKLFKLKVVVERKYTKKKIKKDGYYGLLKLH